MTKQEKINEIKRAFASITALKKQIADLEFEIKAEQAILNELIPAGETLGDVKHNFFEVPAVSYAKYAEHLLTMIPKTKRQEAELLKKQFTKINMQHRYTGAGEPSSEEA